MDAGLITVTPAPVKIGPNSIDLRLGDTLKMYHPIEGRYKVRDPASGVVYFAIDPKNPPPLIDVPKVNTVRPNPPSKGSQGTPTYPHKDAWLLVPGQFYLGCTLEETYCKGVVPHLDGRSTCGRLSIEAHKTAGVGDNGFRGKWTLEIEATEPVLVSPGDRLFQIYFSPCWGDWVAQAIRLQHQGAGVQHLQQLAPLLELDDLYGKGEGHHYQGQDGIKGASPLD